MLTPVSGKTVKTSKSKAKNNKAGPETPTSNVGSPLNPATPAGTCRYDSSLGITLHLRFLLLDLSNITLSIVMLAVTYILLIVVQGF